MIRASVLAMVCAFALVSSVHAQGSERGPLTGFVAHVGVGVPLQTTADAYENPALHADAAIEIGSPSAFRRLGFRVGFGFNRFEPKTTANTSNLNLTSGTGEVVLAAEPARSLIGIRLSGGAGFYHHRVPVGQTGVNFSRSTSHFGVTGGLSFRLLGRRAISPDIEARGHYVWSGNSTHISYVTIGLGVAGG